MRLQMSLFPFLWEDLSNERIMVFKLTLYGFLLNLISFFQDPMVVVKKEQMTQRKIEKSGAMIAAKGDYFYAPFALMTAELNVVGIHKILVSFSLTPHVCVCKARVFASFFWRNPSKASTCALYLHQPQSSCATTFTHILRPPFAEQ